MKCDGCGNEEAYNIRGGYYKAEDGTQKKYEVCDKCGNLRLTATPDVSDVHEPYFDEHLADKSHPDGRWIHSRRQKADILKQLGYREKRESTIKYIADPVARQKYFKSQFGG